MKSTRQSGGLLLVVVAVMALSGIILVGYLIIKRLSNWHPDPSHGQGTNAEPDALVLYDLAGLEAKYGPIHVEMPDFCVSLPPESLAYTWYYTTERSSNMVDWETVELDWDQITNNPANRRTFYRLVLRY